MHFCQSRKIHPDPELKVAGSVIPVEKEAKCLGILFDENLSFIPHIKYVKTKCLKALDLIKVVAHSDWGADRRTIMTLYKSLVRSKLDYGSVVYGSARKSYVKLLETIHH